jgi:hypothetical protein
MGYYTNYTLKLEKNNQKIIKHLREINQCAKHAIDKNGDTLEQLKWYQHESDLCDFSLKYPDIILKLYGEGDENNDLWIKYFKNGKMQLCKAIINYDNFNENKLKTLS